MSDRSKESREDMLERILAETAKNPYVPRKQIRPSQRNETPQSRMAASREKTARQGGGADSGIPVTRILTEAQKAEAAKARAAKKVEEMRRARLEREVQEERRITEFLKNEQPESVPEPTAAEEITAENPAETAAEPMPMPEPEPKSKKKKKSRKPADDSGIWDSDSGKAEAEAIKENAGSKFGLNDALEIVEYAIAAALIIIMIFTYVIRIAVVDGKSMSPTLESGDKLIVRSLLYTPADGDVVVINNKSSNLISEDGKVIEGDGLKKVIVKRVIATGGQTVDIDFKNGIVKVDGKVLEEKYINESTTRDEFAFKYPLEIPEGYVFVMGDNRNVSMDSRHPQIGLVPADKILGEVIFRAYPFDRFGGID